MRESGGTTASYLSLRYWMCSTCRLCGQNTWDVGPCVPSSYGLIKPLTTDGKDAHGETYINAWYQSFPGLVVMWYVFDPSQKTH